MKRPTLFLALAISVALSWGGFTVYKAFVRKQENDKKIEEYKRRTVFQKKSQMDLENSKRISNSQPALRK